MKIQKIYRAIVIVILTIAFVYGMLILSEQNTCTGVREYNCEK